LSAPYDATGKMRIVTSQPLLGRVVVIAGRDPQLGPVAEAAARDGALVAVVGSTLPADPSVAVRFATDPADPAVWERVAMHVEQHLGPVDDVVTDAAAAAVVRAVFEPDLRRRGHGAVHVIAASDDVDAVVTRLRGTR
jgi:hypothetical protein